MASVQNCVQNSIAFIHTPDAPPSFEEIFNTNYTNGLESIYKLETIDLKTVRKLSIPIEVTEDKPYSLPDSWNDEQFSFDLGPIYRGWLAPYLFQEPIQVLQLAKPVEKILLTSGIKTLSALKQCDLQALKMGQGHIEDVRAAIKSYFKGKVLTKTTSIDFLSLIKCIFADKELHKIFVFLEPFELHHWISLTPSESMEIKRASQEQKNEWVLEIKNTLNHDIIRGHFSLIIETWVKPWLLMREGIGTKEELLEFLNIRALNASVGNRALKCLSEFVDPFLSLPKVVGCYTISKEIADCYRLIHETAESYFMHSDEEYLLTELSLFIAKELIANWHTISLNQICYLLKNSPHFMCFRKADGKWVVKSAPMLMGHLFDHS